MYKTQCLSGGAGRELGERRTLAGWQEGPVQGEGKAWLGWGGGEEGLIKALRRGAEGRGAKGRGRFAQGAVIPPTSFSCLLFFHF